MEFLMDFECCTLFSYRIYTYTFLGVGNCQITAREIIDAIAGKYDGSC